MTNYCLAFRGRPDRTPAEGEVEAWGAWFGTLGPAVVDHGNRVLHAKTLRPEGAGAPEATVLTGYVVIAAEDLDAAAKLAAGCPGLSNGVSVEIAETVSM